MGDHLYPSSAHPKTAPQKELEKKIMNKVTP
jgi:hypothetical protein